MDGALISPHQHSAQYAIARREPLFQAYNALSGQRQTYRNGFSSPSNVGISSVTVGWMCTARWITV